MANETIKSIKDCQSIFSNGKYVLASGKKMWIFRTDGTFVAKLQPIRYPAKVAFLPDNTALIDGTSDGSYHYISLEHGEVLWSSLQKGRRSRRSKRFAVSPDGTIIYDVHYRDMNSLCIDVIVPHKRLHKSYTIKDGFRVTHDIYCDEDGALCLMQSQINVARNDDAISDKSSCRQNGILKVQIDGDTVTKQWVQLWQSAPGSSAVVRSCDGKYALQTDFSVVNLQTMTVHPLLDTSELDKLPTVGFSCSFDPMRKLLTVVFIREQLNAVIDCHTRKVVGLYPRDQGHIGYEGCLIDDAFWMGTCDGIVKLSLPNVET